MWPQIYWTVSPECVIVVIAQQFFNEGGPEGSRLSLSSIYQVKIASTKPYIHINPHASFKHNHQNLHPDHSNSFCCNFYNF